MKKVVPPILLIGVLLAGCSSPVVPYTPERHTISDAERNASNQFPDPAHPDKLGKYSGTVLRNVRMGDGYEFAEPMQEDGLIVPGNE